MSTLEPLRHSSFEERDRRRQGAGWGSMGIEDFFQEDHDEVLKEEFPERTCMVCADHSQRPA